MFLQWSGRRQPGPQWGHWFSQLRPSRRVPAAIGFTTIELKSNFLGTARDGAVTTEATLTHGGRTTQVWDAVETIATTSSLAELKRSNRAPLDFS